MVGSWYVEYVPLISSELIENRAIPWILIKSRSDWQHVEFLMGRAFEVCFPWIV